MVLEKNLKIRNQSITTWKGLKNSINDVKVEVKASSISINPSIGSILEFIVKIENLQRFYDTIVKYEEQILSFFNRLNLLEKENFGNEIELYYVISNELINFITKELEKSNKILKTSIKQRLILETQINDSFNQLELIYDQLNNILENISQDHSISNLQTTIDKIELLNNKYKIIKIPRTYSLKFLDHSYQQELKSLLILQEGVNKLIIDIGMKVKRPLS